jgi:hypothetical protein
MEKHVQSQISDCSRSGVKVADQCESQLESGNTLQVNVHVFLRYALEFVDRLVQDAVGEKSHSCKIMSYLFQKLFDGS